MNDAGSDNDDVDGTGSIAAGAWTSRLVILRRPPRSSLVPLLLAPAGSQRNERGADEVVFEANQASWTRVEMKDGDEVDFDVKCREWFRSLPDELRAEVRATIGLIPDWMVVSLERADISVVAVHKTDGRRVDGYLMPSALMLFLAELPS